MSGRGTACMEPTADNVLFLLVVPAVGRVVPLEAPSVRPQLTFVWGLPTVYWPTVAAVSTFGDGGPRPTW